MKLVGITAPFTGSGKTLATMALLSRIPDSLSFKIGPDYIDGQMHAMVSGRRTISIDRWLQGRKYSTMPCRFAGRYSTGIVEGVMGFRDSGSATDLSTHFYFERMRIPYILVINVSRMAESSYYMARGFMGKRCLGIIINDYYSEKHLEMVEKVFRDKGVRIIGKIPHNCDLMLPERHLGIGTDVSPDKVRKIADSAGKEIDISFLSELNDMPCEEQTQFVSKGNKKIWVALDRAFNFYYESSLSALARLGEIHYFSPLENEVPENPDLIYVGGGYPELHAERLAENRRTTSAIQDASESGVPVIGECGGLMYLENRILQGNREYQMTGVFPGTVNGTGKLTLGYTKMKAVSGSLLFRKGETAYGHEFHYSTVSDSTGKRLLNLIGKGMDGMDGVQSWNTFASYSHFDLERYFSRIRKAVE